MIKSSDSKFKPGEKVNLEILRETPMGFVASINQTDEGLLYHNEIFERLEPGQKIPGYIRGIRPEGGIDLILQAFGNLGSDEIGLRILQVLAAANGRLELNNQTSAEKIYEMFGVSKKKYKIALGGLYKSRKITISDSHIELVKKGVIK